MTQLIPLYAIGVFLSFTLSQGAMTRRWYKIGKLKPSEENVEHGSTLRFVKDWPMRMVINGSGSICTAVVMMVFAVTKFSDGAYVVLILIPALTGIFWLIHSHYQGLATKLSLNNFGISSPINTRHRVIMPLSSVQQGQGALVALRYARMLSDDLTAVHVMIEPADAEKIRRKWEKYGEGVRMVMLNSPYRLLLEPLLEYIEEIARQRQAGKIMTIVVPEFVSNNPITSPLHMNTAELLRRQLKRQPGMVIIDVPYQVHE